MTKKRSEKEKFERAGICLIGLGIGMIIGTLIVMMFWGA